MIQPWPADHVERWPLERLGAGEALNGEDDVPGVPETPVARADDPALLGNHRLLCGDATSASDVPRLLGGVVPQVMVTDPPYDGGVRSLVAE